MLLPHQQAVQTRPRHPVFPLRAYVAKLAQHFDKLADDFFSYDLATLAGTLVQGTDRAYSTASHSL